ncbi:MAG: hypothetical protein PHS37_05305 [Candidatus Omnitrophica bacterium]|nr:hypothetical protein [Candidatus Omnitrophota bacterium]
MWEMEASALSSSIGRSLGLYGLRDAWIRGNQLARIYRDDAHERINAMYDLDELFVKYAATLDWDELFRAFKQYGLDRDDTDLNIAAGVQDNDGLAIKKAMEELPYTPDWLSRIAGDTGRTAREVILESKALRKFLFGTDIKSFMSGKDHAGLILHHAVQKGLDSYKDASAIVEKQRFDWERLDDNGKGRSLWVYTGQYQGDRISGVAYLEMLFNGTVIQETGIRTAYRLVERFVQDEMPELKKLGDFNISIPSGYIYDLLLRICGIDAVDFTPPGSESDRVLMVKNPAAVRNIHQVTQKDASIPAPATTVMPEIRYDDLWGRPGRQPTDEEAGIYGTALYQLHTNGKTGRIARPDDDARLIAHDVCESVLSGEGIARGIDVLPLVNDPRSDRGNTAVVDMDQFVMVRSDHPSVKSLATVNVEGCTGFVVKAVDAEGFEWFGLAHLMGRKDRPLLVYEEIIYILNMLASKGFKDVRVQLDLNGDNRIGLPVTDALTAASLKAKVGGMDFKLLPHLVRSDAHNPGGIVGDLIVSVDSIVCTHYKYDTKVKTYSVKDWSIDLSDNEVEARRLDALYFEHFNYANYKEALTGLSGAFDSNIITPAGEDHNQDRVVNIAEARSGSYRFGIFKDRLVWKGFSQKTTGNVKGKIADCHVADAILVRHDHEEDVLGTQFLQECDGAAGRIVLGGVPYLFAYHFNSDRRSEDFRTFMTWLLEQSESPESFECVVSVRRPLDETDLPGDGERISLKEAVDHLKSRFAGISFDFVRTPLDDRPYRFMTVSSTGVVCRAARPIYPGVIEDENGLRLKVTVDWSDATSEYRPFRTPLPVQETGRNNFAGTRELLTMSKEDIFALVDARYTQLTRHMQADWNFARLFARALGYGEDSAFMKKLHAACLAHDIGGALGVPEEDAELTELFALARKNEIVCDHRTHESIVQEFSDKGVELTERQRELVPFLNHAINSLMVLDRAGIIVDDDVRYTIENHMAPSSDNELATQSRERQDMLACLLMADAFEFANNGYKKLQGKRDAVKFETPEETMTFLKAKRFGRHASLQGTLDKVIAKKCIDTQAFGEAIHFSRMDEQSRQESILLLLQSRPQFYDDVESLMLTLDQNNPAILSIFGTREAKLDYVREFIESNRHSPPENPSQPLTIMEELRQNAAIVERSDRFNANVKFALHIGEGLNIGKDGGTTTHRQFNEIFEHDSVQADIVYLPYEIKKEDKAKLYRLLDLFLSDDRFVGFDTGAPFKTDVEKYLAWRQKPVTITAGETGNGFDFVFKNARQEVCGGNEDGEAWASWYKKLLGKGLFAHKRIVILGGNGASGRAVADQLIKENAGSVYFTELDKYLPSARAFEEKLRGNAGEACEIGLIPASDRASLKNMIEQADIIIDATKPEDEKKDISPIADIDFKVKPGVIAIDLKYRPRPVTPFLEHMGNHGAIICNGVGFMVELNARSALRVLRGEHRALPEDDVQKIAQIIADYLAKDGLDPGTLSAHDAGPVFFKTQELKINLDNQEVSPDALAERIRSARREGNAFLFIAKVEDGTVKIVTGTVHGDMLGRNPEFREYAIRGSLQQNIRRIEQIDTIELHHLTDNPDNFGRAHDDLIVIARLLEAAGVSEELPIDLESSRTLYVHDALFENPVPKTIGELARLETREEKLRNPAATPARSRPTSPAECLETIKNDDAMLDAMSSRSGMPVSEDEEKFYKILSEAGICSPVEGKIRRYCFTDMMEGRKAFIEDWKTTTSLQEEARRIEAINVTKSLINAACDMRMPEDRADALPVLRRTAIDEQDIPTVREFVKMTVIHEINKRLEPAIPPQKIMWHVIDHGMIDIQQLPYFQNMNRDLDDGKSRERIRFVKAHETLAQVLEEIHHEHPGAVIDVATNDYARLAAISDPAIKALVIEGAAGDFRQIEGLIAALRALHIDRLRVIPTLFHIYAALGATGKTGNENRYDTLLKLFETDPREFARKFIYILPPIERLPDDLPRLNRLMRTFITSA